jgi:hypothetical protein
MVGENRKEGSAAHAWDRRVWCGRIGKLIDLVDDREVRGKRRILDKEVT